MLSLPWLTLSVADQPLPELERWLDKVGVGGAGVHIIPVARKEEMKSREMQRPRKGNPNLEMILM